MSLTRPEAIFLCCAHTTVRQTESGKGCWKAGAQMDTRGKARNARKVLSPEILKTIPIPPTPPKSVVCSLRSEIYQFLRLCHQETTNCPVCGEGADFHVTPILMTDRSIGDGCGIQKDHSSCPGCVEVLVAVQQGTGAWPGCTRRGEGHALTQSSPARPPCGPGPT